MVDAPARTATPRTVARGRAGARGGTSAGAVAETPRTTPALEPLGLTTTSDTSADLDALGLASPGFDPVEQGTADDGTADTGTGHRTDREVGLVPVHDPLAEAIDRALTQTGVETEDVLRLLRLLEEHTSVLPPTLLPGGVLWLRLMRYLLERAEYRHATRLFVKQQKQATSWVELTLDRLWPVHWGVALNATVGATFGIPLQVTGKVEFWLVRTNRTTVQLIRQGTLNGGFDTGIGAGAYLRLGPRGVGATAGAQAQLGRQIVVREEFEFPVLEDPGLLPLLVALTGVSTLVAVVGLFESSLRQLDPNLYRSRVKLEVKAVGSAVASAEAGLRTLEVAPGTKAQRLQRSKFERIDGKSDTGRREFFFFDEKRTEKLNWRAIVQSMLRASVSAQVTMDVGGGVEVKLDIERDATGARRLKTLDLQLYGEGQTVASIAAHVPVVGALIPNLSVDLGAGIRLLWRAKGPFRDVTDVDFDLVGHEVYVKSGDLDAYDGPAHESVLQLPGLDLDVYSSLATFLAAIETSTMEHRFAVGSPLGRNYVVALGRSGTFTVMLSRKYREWGFHVQGFVTVKFRLPAEVLSRILGKMGDVLVETLEADPKVKALVKKVTQGLEAKASPPDITKAAEEAAISVIAEATRALQKFLDTGKLPAVLQRLADEVLGELLGGLRKVELHVEGGLGLAFGASAAKGAKVRFTGHGSARLVYHRDATEPLRTLLSDGIMTTADLLSLLRGAWDEAPAVLDVLAKELR